MPDRGLMVMLVEIFGQLLNIGRDQSSQTHASLGLRMEREKGKGAQGLGKAVGLVWFKRTKRSIVDFGVTG
jgi:hypothetical protein